MAILHKLEFGKAYCRGILKRNPRKFILYFLSFIPLSLYFRNLYTFLEF
jgi:hypothetical protein